MMQTGGFIAVLYLAFYIPGQVSADCGEPPIVANSTHTGSGYLNGDSREYDCDPGFNMNGYDVIYCTSDDVWSPSPTCNRKSCGGAPSVSNSARTGNGTRFLDYQTYTCNLGYEMTGSATIFCNVSGWTPNKPTCNKIDCGTPPSISLGTAQYTSTLYQDSATYTCNIGYEVTGQNYITCRASGSWTSPPTCTAVSCGSEPTLTDGSLVSSTGSSYQDTATYTCNTGHDMDGPDTVTCQSDRQWSPLPLCRARDCGTPPSISRGSPSYTATTYGEVATYSCNTGYEVNGPAQITCQASGAWSTEPTCVELDCGSVPIVPDSTVSGSGTTYQSSRQYTCDDGFSRYGSDTILCEDSGSWSQPPVCYVPCSVEPAVDNATSVGSGLEYRDTRTFTCDPGFEGQGNPQATCQVDGTWLVQFSCNIISCTNPPTILNGILTGYGNEYTDTRTVTCHDGYEMSGPAIISCQANGNWSTAPTCNRKDCGIPPTIADSTSNVTGTLYQDDVIVTCDIGYDMTGSNTVTCQGNGTWSTPPVCQRKDCGQPPVVTNASYTGNGTLYQDTQVYTCDTGFTMLGQQPHITCLYTGQWSTPPMCTISTCLNPPSVLTATPYVTGRSYGDTVTYNCTEGYSLQWPDYLTCDQNSLWSAYPTCIRIQCGLPPEVTNGRTSGVGEYYNDNRTYECDSGYDLVGPDVIYCQANGTWSGVPYCTDISTGCNREENVTYMYDMTWSTLNQSDAVMLRRRIQELRTLLKINEKSLTMHTLKRKSVYEERTTSVSIGAIASGLMLMFLAFAIILPDIPKIYHDMLYLPQPKTS